MNIILKKKLMFEFKFQQFARKRIVLFDTGAIITLVSE